MKKILIIDDEICDLLMGVLGVFLGIPTSFTYLKKFYWGIRSTAERLKKMAGMEKYANKSNASTNLSLDFENLKKKTIRSEGWINQDRLDYYGELLILVAKIISEMGHLFSITNPNKDLVREIKSKHKKEILSMTCDISSDEINKANCLLKLFNEVGQKRNVSIDVLLGTYKPSLFEVARDFCKNVAPGAYDLILLDLGFIVPNHNRDYTKDEDFLLDENNGGVKIGRILKERRIPFVIWTGEPGHAMKNVILAKESGLISEETFQSFNNGYFNGRRGGRKNNLICLQKDGGFIPYDPFDSGAKERIEKIFGYLKEELG